MRASIVALVVTVLVLGLIALASVYRERTPAQRAERLTERMSIELELDPEQKAKAWALIMGLVEEQQRWRTEQATMGTALQAQFRSPALDAAALDRSLTAQTANLGQQRHQLIQKLAAFHAALKPEQRVQAADMLKQYALTF